MSFFLNNRVVVTGMGIISPIGVGLNENWHGMINPKNVVKPIKDFDTTHIRSNMVGIADSFIPKNYLPHFSNNFLELPRASQFSILCVDEALKQAKIDQNIINKNSIDVIVGTTMGEMQVIEDLVEKYINRECDLISENIVKKYPSNNITNNILSFFDFNGSGIIIPSACAAGNYAIGYGYDIIRSGKRDIVVAGGVDPISKIAFIGFNKLMACSPDVCSPFSLNRKGMIVSEGAGFLILENIDSAKRRNIPILAEILGYGVSNDGYKSTIPHPEGKGGILAIEKALKNSNISKNKVDYICAHGTGTIENDRVETIISKEIFGKSAYNIPISSIKSIIGHTMGACSAIETIASIKMINEKILIPTINYSEKDPLCDLDYVPNIPRNYDVKIVLNNSYAFGGNNSSLVIGEYNG
jgi:3-oxoacyl-[acyl-carrier-protein] synthase II